MGVHNRITKEKFTKIKEKVTEPKNDAAVAVEFGVGEKTVRNIRLSNDYQAYCEKVFRFHGNPGKKSSTKAKKSNAEPPTVGFELYKPSGRKIDSFESMESELKGLRIYVYMIVFLPFLVTAIVIVLGLIALVKTLFGGGA